MTENRLPHVLVSSVIRTATVGESHGGLYVVDLEASRSERVIDWDDTSISFRDRGAERGLRGLAFRDELTYVTTFDKIVVYDRDFRQVDEFTNAYLADCHETWIDGPSLHVTSTGYDSILTFDLDAGRFVQGVCLRNDLDRLAKKALWKLFGMKRPSGVKLTRFDPNATNGPRADDVIHLNSVFVDDGVMYASSYRAAAFFALRDGGAEAVSPLPDQTHNAQLFRDGVLFANTGNDEVLYCSLDGVLRRRFPAVTIPRDEMRYADLPDETARPGFVRGLTTFADEFLIFGVSPATIVVYHIDSGEMVKTVNLSKDVRNAVHGLEIYPYS